MRTYIPDQMCNLCNRWGTGKGDHNRHDRKCKETYWPHGFLPWDEEILPNKMENESWDSYKYRVGL